MPFSQSIANFTEALEATRAELTAVNGRIDDMERERLQIVNAAPHSEDIAAVFLRGVQAASSAFTSQLASRLADTYVNDDGTAAAAASPRSSANVLRLEPVKPDRETLLTRSMKGGEADLNFGALVYFLRDQIAAEIPMLVDKLCPASRDGMKQADRAAALTQIDAKLVELRDEARRLNEDLNAARAAVTRQ